MLGIVYSGMKSMLLPTYMNTDNENQKYSWELKFGNNRLESDNNYLYTIKGNKTGLIVEKFDIKSWDEVSDVILAKSE